MEGWLKGYAPLFVMFRHDNATTSAVERLMRTSAAAAPNVHLNFPAHKSTLNKYKMNEIFSCIL
jgi:hypothetical protein